jgi:hypothetical protein
VGEQHHLAAAAPSGLILGPLEEEAAEATATDRRMHPEVLELAAASPGQPVHPTADRPVVVTDEGGELAQVVVVGGGDGGLGYTPLEDGDVVGVGIGIINPMRSSSSVSRSTAVPAHRNSITPSAMISCHPNNADGWCPHSIGVI